MCPAAKPRCAGYVANERWGECRGRRLESGEGQASPTHGMILLLPIEAGPQPRWPTTQSDQGNSTRGPDVNMTAACRDQCAAALSRPPRRFDHGSAHARRRPSRGARSPTPVLLDQDSSYSTTRSVDFLPRHPDAALAALGGQVPEPRDARPRRSRESAQGGAVAADECTMSGGRAGY